MFSYSFSFYLLIDLFFIYSVIGYITEIMSIYRFTHKVILSRGYLIGPYLPIFGLGSILMITLLEPYKNDLFVLFVMSLVICCLLEYFTSLLMEKIFKLRWWDYSEKMFNINGRVCLENGVMFGLGGVIIVKCVNPFLLQGLMSLPVTVVIISGMVVSCIMIADFIVSTYTVLQLKVDLSAFKEKDSTVRIKKEIIDSILKYQFFHRRLFKAFPNITGNKYVVEFEKMSKKREKRLKRKEEKNNK